MIKISFIGDVMCELPLLRAYKHYGTSVYDDLFEDSRELLEKSDYVVANLETVCAGENAGYTKELYSFNTPDDFIESIAKSPINMVLTANNHCFDRGESGLERTMRLLNEFGVTYSGSYMPENQAIPIIEINGSKIGIYSLTQSTNYFSNHVLASDTKHLILNTIGPNNRNVYTGKEYTNSITKASKRRISEENRLRIKRLLGRSYNSARRDDYLDRKLLEPYLYQIAGNIRKAKEESDVMLICPHMGGQFNLVPGAFSEYMMNWFLCNGADAVIASHPHVIQKAKVINGTPLYYSLGNFSISPSSAYLLPKHLPEYGLIAHIYIQDKKICKAAFSILWISESRDHRIKVFPIHQIENPSAKMRDDITKIVSTVRGNIEESTLIQEEFELSLLTNK